MAAKRRWSDLSVRTRRLIIVGASLKGLLKVAALVDIWRRPASQVKGPKAAWAVAVALANSVGTVPLSYFFFGRRKSG